MLRLSRSRAKLAAQLDVRPIRKKTLTFFLLQSLFPSPFPFLSFLHPKKFDWIHAVFSYFMLSYIFIFTHIHPLELANANRICCCLSGYNCTTVAVPCSRVALIHIVVLPLIMFFFPTAALQPGRRTCCLPPPWSIRTPRGHEANPPVGKQPPGKNHAVLPTQTTTQWLHQRRYSKPLRQYLLSV